MSADPLAELLAEIDELPIRLIGRAGRWSVEADWLRANRDRVLEALGGERPTRSMVTSLNNSGCDWNVFACADARPGYVDGIWLFPKESDE